MTAGAQEAARDLRIAGTVVNGATSAPVRQALVTLNMFRPGTGPNQPPRIANRAVLTDLAGHFQFDRLEAGSYSYSVVKNGFAAQQHAQITLDASQNSLVVRASPVL